MDKFLESVEKYYSEKIVKYGASALGVDWSSESGQLTRFEILSRVLPRGNSRPYSILDFGSGYGAFANYLANQNMKYSYYAFDISKNMRITSRVNLKSLANCTVLDELIDGSTFDYILMNGVFNVKLTNNVDSWRVYVQDLIDELYQMANQALSYNLLTSFSDFEFKQDHLFYEDPGAHLNFLLEKYGRKVEINHTTSLYEFTVIIYK